MQTLKISYDVFSEEWYKKVEEFVLGEFRFNEEQKKFIYYFNSSIIEAGPGSGKTTALAAKVALLLKKIEEEGSLVFIQLFSVQLGIFPTGGASGWKSYIMPSFALGAGIMAMIARFTRSSLVDSMKQDYIRMGRSKGLGNRAIVFGHALKNSLIPVVTVAGLQFGFLLGGSVVVETVFSFPGLGTLLIDSIEFRDYPVIQAEILLFAVQFILVNLLIDIVYSFLNPRIRYE